MLLGRESVQHLLKAYFLLLGHLLCDFIKLLLQALAVVQRIFVLLPLSLLLILLQLLVFERTDDCLNACRDILDPLMCCLELLLRHHFVRLGILQELLDRFFEDEVTALLLGEGQTLAIATSLALACELGCLSSHDLHQTRHT